MYLYEHWNVNTTFEILLVTCFALNAEGSAERTKLKICSWMVHLLRFLCYLGRFVTVQSQLPNAWSSVAFLLYLVMSVIPLPNAKLPLIIWSCIN